MMWKYSTKMQSLSNQGNAPVILLDAYFNKTYLWRPKND